MNSNTQTQSDLFGLSGPGWSFQFEDWQDRLMAAIDACVEDVHRQLNELSKRAEQEHRDACVWSLGSSMTSALSFMTQDELSRRHSLILSLPMQGDIARRARANIQKRIEQRRRGVQAAA